MKIKSLLCCLACLGLFFGCSANQDPDPVGAEKIIEQTPSLRTYNDNQGFKVFYNDDPIMGSPYYFRMNTPAENAKLILACCNQSLDLYGYKIMYNADGSVSDVIALHIEDDKWPEFEDAAVLKACKRWMNDSGLEYARFPISHGESGDVTSVGSIDVPSGFSADYWIQEWGNDFWESDTRGGTLAFFVKLGEEDKEGRSTVDYLYCDGHLVAELADWNGTLIQVLYYDLDGHFMGIKEERNYDRVFQDIWDNCHNDRTFKWYLDTKWQ